MIGGMIGWSFAFVWITKPTKDLFHCGVEPVLFFGFIGGVGGWCLAPD